MHHDEIDKDGYQYRETVVLGAGLVGMATAAAYAEKSREKNLLVLEKGAKNSYRDHTSSQGGLRGSRTADQTEDLTRDIRGTWRFIKALEEKYDIAIQHESSKDHPYLMAIKDTDHFNGMKQDLTDKHSPFKAYTAAKAERRFKIKIPTGYAGVINTLESKTFDIAAYFYALEQEILSHTGEVRYETSIKKYGKHNDGFHRIALSDGTKYKVKNLVVATGVAIKETAEQLQAMHQQSFNLYPMAFKPEQHIPKRIQSSIKVPQRTLHVAFDIPVSRITLYNLDFDRVVHVSKRKKENHVGNLSFYMFPETFKDAEGNIHDGLKIGYDPMGRSVEDESELNRQEARMIEHISRTYGIDISSIRVISRHSCAYSLDMEHHPCMGKSNEESEFGLIFATNFIGYGAMAAYGAAKRMIDGHMKDSPRYHPDAEPAETSQALYDSYYGPDKHFPVPPSASKPYGNLPAREK